METKKHTPGHWKVDKYGIVYTEETTVCKVIGQGDMRFADSEEEKQANLKLIAAAPEMLEALIEIRDYHHRCSAKGDPVLSPHWEGVVKEAIKKATE